MAVLFSFEYSIYKNVESTDEYEVALWDMEDDWATILYLKCLVVDRREGPYKNVLNVMQILLMV